MTAELTREQARAIARIYLTIDERIAAEEAEAAEETA